jgi:hypothetical protein
MPNIHRQVTVVISPDEVMNILRQHGQVPENAVAKFSHRVGDSRGSACSAHAPHVSFTYTEGLTPTSTYGGPG